MGQLKVVICKAFEATSIIVDYCNSQSSALEDLFQSVM